MSAEHTTTIRAITKAFGRVGITPDISDSGMTRTFTDGEGGNHSSILVGSDNDRINGEAVPLLASRITAVRMRKAQNQQGSSHR